MKRIGPDPRLRYGGRLREGVLIDPVSFAQVGRKVESDDVEIVGDGVRTDEAS